MKTTFTTTVLQEPGMNATGIRVPEQAIAELGAGKKPAVKVNLAGYQYRTTIAVSGGAYGGAYMLSLSKEHREAAGIKAGDTVEVTLELDSEPRTVELPKDLVAALADRPGARQAFDKLAFSMRKEYVRQVESAKAAETRTRRIAGIVDKMTV